MNSRNIREHGSCRKAKGQRPTLRTGCCWSKSCSEDGYHQYMKDLVIATAIDYLLRYCQQANLTYILCGDLLLVACSLEENRTILLQKRLVLCSPIKNVSKVDQQPRVCNCCFLVVIPVKETCSDTIFWFAQATLQYTSREWTINGSFHPQDGSLPMPKGPDSQAQKDSRTPISTTIDNLFQCSSCLQRHCAEVCARADWDNGKPGWNCKLRQTQQSIWAIREIQRRCSIGGRWKFLDLSEEKRSGVCQFLGSQTKEDLN